MSLRDKRKAEQGQSDGVDLFERFGVLVNPFPAAGQTSNNPHLPSEADDEAEARIISFLRDGRSQVVVIEGTQGVGKTNFLNYFENNIRDALREEAGYYVVRYLADPEASFDATIRRLIQELGPSHISDLADALQRSTEAVETVRGHDMRAALLSLARAKDAEQSVKLFMDWVLGSRLLKGHREILNVQSRLDTVESKTAALRDLVIVSSALNLLKGIFLLLDELEKQDGVLGPTAIVRYLSAMRAIIDALPNHLFMMIAVTPDAMRRYSAALPAFRSRLQNQVTLSPLTDVDQALKLAAFYLEHARSEARQARPSARGGAAELVSTEQILDAFDRLAKLGQRRADVGVPQRAFLHELHTIAEYVIQGREA
jgi:hypothetical protein